MRLLLPALCLLLFTGCCLAAQVTVLDDFKYPDVTAVRAAWVESMGGVPAELFTDGGKTAVKILCPFAAKPECPRGSLDKAVTLDLTRAGAIVFDFYADNPAALSYCAIYFHSGDGWYGTSFGVEKGWNHISIGKGNFRIEDKPAGWDKVDTIRISAWRGLPRDTFCALANLQTRTEDVAVVSGIIEGAEGHSATAMAKTVSGFLEKTGVPFGVLTDTDVEQGALAGQKLAIFAYSPRLSDTALTQIKSYVASGGKIIVCYTLPATLAELLGVTQPNYRPRAKDGDFAAIGFAADTLPGLPTTMGQGSWNITAFEAGTTHNARVIGTWKDAQGNEQGPAVLLSDNGAFVGHVLTESDPGNKQAFLMSLIGHFVPGTWETAATGAVAAARQVGPFRTPDDLDAFLRTAQRDQDYGTKVTAALAEAAAAEKQAKQLLAEKRYPEVLAFAQKLHDAVAGAYYVAHKPRDGEFRAVWNHSGTGDCGSWDEAMKRLKAANFNAVVPNMWWGGLAHYDSKLLPLSKTFKDRGDQIAECVAAGKKYGVEVHPWKVNWNLSTAPKEFVDRMRAEGRLMVNSKGETEGWLCASNPQNLQLEIDTMLEVARNYDVDGIHFDYIRYPHDDGCFCNGCRQRFEARLGRKVEHWPADCKDALREEWMQFRCDNISKLVQSVSEQAHQEKPWLKVSAAVFSNYPNCKYDVGQDWVKWCKNGWLDFVCPMNYFDGNTQFTNTLSNQLAYVGNAVPLYSGIGSWINTTDNTIAQMEITRQLGADGFICFHMGEDLTLWGFPQFAKGVTAAPAVLPHNGPQLRFSSPLDTAAQATVLTDGKLTVQVEVLGPGRHRKSVTALTGALELQDAAGKKLAELGTLPKIGQSAAVSLNLEAGLAKLTPLVRVAAVGTMTFEDGTKAPFVVRSRGYLFPAAH